MPLVVDSPQGPALWFGADGLRPAGSANNWGAREDCVRIALVNNMPDSALEDTESQFCHLLDAAAEKFLVRVKLFSLPNISRCERGLDRLGRLYFDLNDLWRDSFDAVIITGTEPHQPDLRCEPFWPALVDVLDWAEENTTSTVLSCLAAHAGVLHSDGICRRPLEDKRFGVFPFRRVADHALADRTESLWRFPHSRWNGLRADALTSCGYTILTQAKDAGVDFFVKKKRKSLFVHFQGHPEYDRLTLFKEYRRDARRFLNRSRETYPSMPSGYFDVAAVSFLNEFRKKALSNRSEDLMADFPESTIADTVQNTWHSLAVRVYRNWLQYVVSRKADTPALVAVSGGRRSEYASARRDLE